LLVPIDKREVEYYGGSKVVRRLDEFWRGV
jgi:hypothetical protein